MIADYFLMCKTPIKNMYNCIKITDFTIYDKTERRGGNNYFQYINCVVLYMSKWYKYSEYTNRLSDF